MRRLKKCKLFETLCAVFWHAETTQYPNIDTRPPRAGSADHNLIVLEYPFAYISGPAHDTEAKIRLETFETVLQKRGLRLHRERFDEKNAMDAAIRALVSAKRSGKDQVVHAAELPRWSSSRDTD